MKRRLHRWFGLGAAGFGLMLAISGSFLALEPVTEAASTGSLTPTPQVSVAVLTDAITQQIDGVERIEKSANHTVWVHFSDANGFGKMAFDPIAMEPISSPPNASIWGMVKIFHRSLFMADLGRAITGATALAMLILTVTGLIMLVHRMGGWRAVLSPPKSGKAQSLHLDLGRIATVGLLVAGISGVWMSLVAFDVVPFETNGHPAFPTIDVAQPALPTVDLIALQDTSLAQLRELVMPYPNDPSDPFTLTTQTGTGYIDPTNGLTVSFVEHGFASQAYKFIYLLHTGQGAWVWGVLLGLSMLAVPVVIVSGFIMAVRRPKSGKRLIKSVPSRTADTIVLVGSEGATTWGFAGELCRKLTVAGKQVHVADLDDLGETYPAAKHLIILTSTYGHGSAPANATRFMDRLQLLNAPHLQYAVLGFGDHSFPQFCEFGKTCETACHAYGIKSIVNFSTIDRQSSQSFQAWGHRLGMALDIPLELDHAPSTPATIQVQLHDRIDFGEDVQAPVSILRLTARRGKLSPHSSGDLLGVVTDECSVPRLYSLASWHTDGFIEICVRRQNGGLVSGILTSMTKGDTLDVFIKPNPAFRPINSRAPLILIGAGAGISPLIGFARKNPATRAATLFWGGRHPDSDFLYEDELAALTKSGRLAGFTTAFSRSVDGVYVQEKLHACADELRRAIEQGGQVMVCGGSAMGADVRAAWDDVLAPIGLSVQHLISQKRYLEDVY